jgi:hypothetical protein
MHRSLEPVCLVTSQEEFSSERETALLLIYEGLQAEVVRERSQREAMESRMKHEKELLEDVLHREMDRASALQAELLQAQQAKVSNFSNNTWS